MNWLRDISRRLRADKLLALFDAARVTVDSNPPIGKLNVFMDIETSTDVNAEKVFKELTEDDLFQMNITDLLETIVGSNGTASRLWDDFVMFGTLDYELTCEDPRGQAMLDEFLMTLETKRNSFDFTLRQLFSQIALRGNFCFEVVLDDNRQFSNFVAVDPDLFYFRSRSDDMDGQVWELIQYDQDGEPVVIDSPLVHFEAINALPGRRKGTALIAPAIPSIISQMLMMQDLREVVNTHAFPERFYTIDHVELKKAGYSLEEITEIVKRARDQVASIAGNRDKSKRPVISGDMRITTDEGGGQNLGFVKDIYDVNDREVIRGGKTTPFNVGSQQYQAESSAHQFAIRDALREESYQASLEHPLGDKFTLVLRGQGITEPAVLRLKRNNAEVLRMAAQVYDVVAGTVQKLTSSGIPVLQALEIIEHSTGATIPEEVKDNIQAAIEEQQAKEEAQREADRQERAQVREEDRRERMETRAAADRQREGENR